MSKKIYMDESGNYGFTFYGNDHLLILSYVVYDSSIEQQLAKEFSEILSTYGVNYFHFIRNKNKFLRQEILNLIIKYISNNDLYIFLQEIDKTSFIAENKRDKQEEMADLIEEQFIYFKSFFRDKLQIYFDGQEPFRGFKAMLEKLKDEKSVHSFQFIRNRSSVGIQLADYAASLTSKRDNSREKALHDTLESEIVSL